MLHYNVTSIIIDVNVCVLEVAGLTKISRFVGSNEPQNLNSISLSRISTNLMACKVLKQMISARSGNQTFAANHFVSLPAYWRFPKFEGECKHCIAKYPPVIPRVFERFRLDNQ